MDKRIKELKKKMIDYGIKPKDLVDHFDWSWTYVSELLNSKNYVTDEQLAMISNTLPLIKESKKEKVVA